MTTTPRQVARARHAVQVMLTVVPVVALYDIIIGWWIVAAVIAVAWSICFGVYLWFRGVERRWKKERQ